MKVAPSILDADFSHLQSELDSIATADRIHLDIMDGKYVPSTTFRAVDLQGYEFPLPLEAHLMVEDPASYFDEFESLGAKGITIHTETQSEAETLNLLADLKERGMRPGICIDGYTKPSALSDEVLNTAEQILVMSVKTGKGGQSFMLESLEKIKELRARGFVGEIEVDGGINLETVRLAEAAGADVVVVGSFLMKRPSGERKDLIQKLEHE